MRPGSFPARHATPWGRGNGIAPRRRRWGENSTTWDLRSWRPTLDPNRFHSIFETVSHMVQPAIQSQFFNILLISHYFCWWNMVKPPLNHNFTAEVPWELLPNGNSIGVHAGGKKGATWRSNGNHGKIWENIEKSHLSGGFNGQLIYNGLFIGISMGKKTQDGI